jgi:hypothetical protein
MKITFVQSGGWGGQPRSCQEDASSLGETESAGLRQLLDRYPQGVCLRSREAKDAFTYSLKIEDGDNTFEISFDDMTFPANAEALVEYLAERAEPMDL